MNQHSRPRQEASASDQPDQQNPALEPFSVLVGNWNTSGTHGLLADAVLHGHTSFEWLENGAFLLMRSHIDDPRVPGTVAVFGSDASGSAEGGAQAKYYMLTFDERGVSRKYDVTLHNNIWKWWRAAPGFSQRYQGIIEEGGNTIITKGELSKDGSSWEKDLDSTYKRVE